MTKGEVECLVGKGELVDIALLKLDILDGGRFSDSLCPWQDIGVDVDTAVGDEPSETHRGGA